MSALQNRQVKLIARPSGMVRRSDFEFTTGTLSEPGPEEVLVKVLYISIDPAMRAWMNEIPSYIAPVGLGEVMRAIGLGQVVASNDARLAAGDFVTGLTGVQEYVIAKADAWTRIDTRLAPLRSHLGMLGMPGKTAYFGLLDVGRPREGETVVVSGAAGAVGSIVGQIAKLKGCRVVGIAGGQDKCRYLTDELGFDAVVDYKKESTVLEHTYKALKERCPNGIDVFFDNVGGEILDAVLLQLARKARIVICGAISQYNNQGAAQGLKFYTSLIVHRARMEGFLVFDYEQRYGEAVKELAGWMAEGKLKGREDVVEGLETFPETFLKLFTGENSGKLLIKVADEPG